MGWQDDPVANQPAPKQVASPAAFVQQYRPMAEKIGAEIGVDPKILLAQFGHETGWGKYVIPGTYNLGNIKDLSGKGVRAKDVREGSNDPYLKFEDPDTFAAYYADFIKQMYPKAVGAGSDVSKFTAGLNKGVGGSYATDKNYPDVIRNAYSLVTSFESGQPIGQKQDKKNYEAIFGVGTLTESQRMAKEPEPPEYKAPEGMSKEDAALYGGAAGLVAGQFAKSTQVPTSAKYNAAVEILNDARTRLTEAQKSGVGGQTLADLENEFRMRRGVATPQVDPRKIPGASGNANWALKMSDEIPDIVAMSATSMRKTDDAGAQRLIDKDVAARQQLSRMGLGHYVLSG